MVRYAFTMIELIFAIVIIAISIVSLPMMSQVTARSMENSLAQEAIFTALAEINLATTYTWDGNSLPITSIDELSRVINTATAPCADTGVDDSNSDNINRRPGHVSRRCSIDLTKTFFTDIGDFDSLHAAAHGYDSTLDVDNTAADTSATGYKKGYQSRLEINRCDSGPCVDFGTAGNENIKEIKVTIRDMSDQSVVTILRTYSANIGEVAYNRSFL